MIELLTGTSSAHIEAGIHRELVQPLKALQGAAAKDGFDVQVCSGFRDFSRQLTIWNTKATGKRKIYAADGKTVLNPETLSEEELVRSILLWSALPGASRHHWGTDIDVYDKTAVPADYSVQLTPEESDGVFGPLHRWLDQNMDDFGFFRPYRENLGGVSPERWHLSYAPLSEKYLLAFHVEGLRSVLESSEIALKETVLSLLPEIFKRYVLNISPR